MRWIIVATLVAVGIGLGLVVLGYELVSAYEPHDSSGAVLAPGQALTRYRDEAAMICKLRGVEQLATEVDVAPTPEVSALAYATERYGDKEYYGVGPRQAAYEGCLAGFRNR